VTQPIQRIFFGKNDKQFCFVKLPDLKLVLIGSSMLPMYKRVPKKKTTFLSDLQQPNLAKSSCGWPPVHLPHKIEIIIIILKKLIKKNPFCILRWKGYSTFIPLSFLITRTLFIVSTSLEVRIVRRICKCHSNLTWFESVWS